MATRVYDAIVIGAGSIGVPAAMNLAGKGLKVLCLDLFASAGQGSNKCAIGGVRPTHAFPAKMKLCLDSMDVFSRWEETWGDNIEWHQGGYVFVAYRPQEQAFLKDRLVVQKKAGLDIHWLDRDELLRVCPGLRPDGLLGGTLAPGDGSASPILSCQAFQRRAEALGAEFRFGERVTRILRQQGKVVGVRTDRGDYATACAVNAAGAWAREVARAGGLEAPVEPESHEGGITEPVAPFLGPMIVDLREAPGSENFYFYQHKPGQLVFCYSPRPAILGTDRRETSDYLPLISRRMVDLMPKLANLRIRRTWRGLYPMTPDKAPIIGRSRDLEGYIEAIGMCELGFMLGPGVGSLVARLATDELRPGDDAILDELSPYRAGVKEA
jgi:sarcosine oxidase subunit beta